MDEIRRVFEAAKKPKKPKAPESSGQDIYTTEAMGHAHLVLVNDIGTGATDEQITSQGRKHKHAVVQWTVVFETEHRHMVEPT